MIGGGVMGLSVLSPGLQIELTPFKLDSFLSNLVVVKKKKKKSVNLIALSKSLT
jgi:hypothetical protein